MSLMVKKRPSDSPFVETIMQGETTAQGTSIRPAERCWHMVFVRHSGKVEPLVVGPLSTAGVAKWGAEAEILWIKFELGTFMPHLPIKDFRDTQTLLPAATDKSFWLKGSAWQIPDFEHADVFVKWLAREELLVHDRAVGAALQHRPPDISPRTLRHRFLQATGLSHTDIRQMDRAQKAATLLQNGASIPDTVYQLGYFDHPHLTRSLKRWVGHTPARLVQLNTAI